MATFTLTKTFPFSTQSSKTDLGAAALESVMTSGDFGFEFSAESLQGLIGKSSVAGIFVYPQLTTNGELQLRAIRASGFEANIPGDISNTQDGVISSENLSFTKIEREVFLTSELANNRWLFAKVFFSSEDLSNLMAGNDALSFRPVVLKMEVGGTLRNVNSLSALVVKNSRAERGIVSLLPCPPHCGDGTYEKKIVVISAN